MSNYLSNLFSSSLFLLSARGSGWRRTFVAIGGDEMDNSTKCQPAITQWRIDTVACIALDACILGSPHFDVSA